jgi:aspartate/methionine/tyrosine aminotransferase
MKKEFHERRDLVVKLLNEIPGFKCLSPGGAFYVWPNVTKACEIVRAKDSEEFRKLLLNEAGVAVLADKHFGPSVDGEGQHIRLSYAISKQNIIEGVKRIKEFVEKSKQ